MFASEMSTGIIHSTMTSKTKEQDDKNKNKIKKRQKKVGEFRSSFM